MDAKESALHSFLSQQVIMNVPIYQRKYNWSSDECKQLFNDILTIGGDEFKKSYFIGSIVFKKEESDQIGGPDNIVLIDGQQRTTTITLIYCALCNYYKERDANLCNYYHNNFLVNNDIEKSYKLNLTKDDDFTLKRIIKSLTIDKEFELKEDDALNVYRNYEYFKKLIKEDNIEILRKGLDKLLFISVGLGNDDNPQLIFESLNSTGLELKKNDLIRNYILMGLDSQHQNELYNNYWYDIEQGFKKEESLFDEFIRYYLAVKNGKLPTKYNIYKDFKTYSREFNNIDDLVKDIYKFSKYFFNILFGQEEDLELLNVFESLKYLGYNMTLPFILSVYDDYKNPEISLDKKDFIKIVKYVESYMLRRSICEIPTNSLNKVFAKLSFEIDKTNYLNSFLEVMVKKDSSRRFPTDTEVLDNILIKNLYSKKKILKHILVNIENSKNKAVLNIDECTIEHIMPQNLSSSWKEELGENYKDIHEKYIHTLGNLTLTFYNSEMSDKSFIEKKTMEGGFKDSKLYLNKQISELDSWGEEEIKNRSEELTNDIINIWQYPGKQVEFDSIDEEVTTSLDEYISDEIIESFDETEDSSELIDDIEELEERSLPRQLLNTLDLMILNIDSSIQKHSGKTYISYKKEKNFVEIISLKKRLRLILDIPISELDDSRNICVDVSDKQILGTGDTKLYLDDEKDVTYVMGLIKQSYEYNLHHGFELKEMPETLLEQKKDITVDNVIFELEKQFNISYIKDDLKIEAERAFNGALEYGVLKGRNKEIGVAASIYIACRLTHVPFSVVEISKICGEKQKLVVKVQKLICQKLNIKLPLVHSKDYIPRYCEILEVSDEVENKAKSLCDEADSKELLSGKSPTGVAASVIYLASLQTGEKRTQEDIGKIVNVTPVSIRKYCRLFEKELNI